MSTHSFGGAGRGRGLFSLASSTISSRFNNSRKLDVPNIEESRTIHMNQSTSTNLVQKLVEEAKDVEVEENIQNTVNHSSEDQDIKSGTKQLPIKEYQDEIIDKINENTVTIISASTGSGKVSKLRKASLLILTLVFCRQHKFLSSFSKMLLNGTKNVTFW